MKAIINRTIRYSEFVVVRRRPISSPLLLLGCALLSSRCAYVSFTWWPPHRHTGDGFSLKSIVLLTLAHDPAHPSPLDRSLTSFFGVNFCFCAVFVRFCNDGKFHCSIQSSDTHAYASGAVIVGISSVFHRRRNDKRVIVACIWRSPHNQESYANLNGNPLTNIFTAKQKSLIQRRPTHVCNPIFLLLLKTILFAAQIVLFTSIFDTIYILNILSSCVCVCASYFRVSFRCFSPICVVCCVGV